MGKRAARVMDVMAAVERIAPAALAAEWDNVGLQVGRRRDPVRRVMTCLELTPPTLSEARRLKADVIVAHHPLLFKPLKALELDSPSGLLVAGLVRSGMALIAAHTNLDAAAWSTNHALAERLALEVERPLFPPASGEVGGLGLVARPRRPVRFATFIEHVRKSLNIRFVRVSGPERDRVERLALCTGAGGSLLGAAAGQAEIFLTGEIKYHEAIEAHARGLTVIEVGHFESEVLIARPLAERLARDPVLAAAGVRCHAAGEDLQPFRYA